MFGYFGQLKKSQVQHVTIEDSFTAFEKYIKYI